MTAGGTMSARLPSAESTYEVAKQWVDRALRTDDSLFEPGTSIWTRRWLTDLHKRFLEQPAVSRIRDFLPSLEQQLAGAPAEVHQLMAETLFIHLLIQYQTVGTKRERIETVLGWHPDTVPFPERLNDGLSGMLVNAEGGFGNKFISYQVGTLIESVMHWKELASSKRMRLIQDPWGFKDFLFKIRFTSSLLANNQNTGDLERHMLLHIVHPDTFEPMLGNDKSRLVKAKAFQRLVPQPNLDIDLTIQHIRGALERKYEKYVNFYDEDIRKYWKPAKKGDTFVEELEGEQIPPDNGIKNPPQYSISNIISDGSFIAHATLESMLKRLQTKRNIILQGPPGTGKTWLAKKLAYALIGQKDKAKVRQVQFHPNLSYEDFVRGWRPESDGTLGLVDGPFLELSEVARRDSNGTYVMVIEEINRGIPASIFGELLTLLEADKRTIEHALTLAHQQEVGERVHIPPNLYVIGTMNTADRSLALVDLALRRRFAFFDLEPALNDTWHNWVHRQCNIPTEFLTEISRRIGTLNDQISADPNLGRQFRIGHSFVVPTPDEDISVPKEWFIQVVETEIAPLLNEYWFDDPDKVDEAKSQLLSGL